MRLLLIKMSSLGDVIHALPAVTDASQRLADLTIDWLVEPSFAVIPGWHPAVRKVIAISLRNLRRAPLAAGSALLAGLQRLRRERYDLILDAQGLLKSATLACCVRGRRVGLASDSAREPLAAWAYHQRFTVDPQTHAIERVRRLMAGALGYCHPSSPADAGLQRCNSPRNATILLLTGTTWPSKRWPASYWIELAQHINAAGYTAQLVAGNAEERHAAARIAAASAAELLPATSLAQLADLLRSCAGAIAADTGLAHLATALATPAIALYGPTSPALTGITGPAQRSLAVSRTCAPCRLRHCPLPPENGIHPPCWTTLTAHQAWQALMDVMATDRVQHNR